MRKIPRELLIPVGILIYHFIIGILYYKFTVQFLFALAALASVGCVAALILIPYWEQITQKKATNKYLQRNEEMRKMVTTFIEENYGDNFTAELEGSVLRVKSKKKLETVVEFPEIQDIHQINKKQVENIKNDVKRILIDCIKKYEEGRQNNENKM